MEAICFSETSVNFQRTALQYIVENSTLQLKGCPKFRISQCKKYLKSICIKLGVDLSKRNKLKFLIDTGAEISVVSGSSLKRRIDCNYDEGIILKEFKVKS
jgi:hypothetical protein